MSKQNKNQNNYKNRRFFVQFSDATMDVDSFACFDVIAIAKKRQLLRHYSIIKKSRTRTGFYRNVIL